MSLTPEKQKTENLYRFLGYAKENIQHSIKKECWCMWVDCFTFIIGAYTGGKQCYLCPRIDMQVGTKWPS